MVLLAGIGIDGVKNDVGMDVLSVYMDGDHSLIAGKVFLGKFFGDLQGQLWGNFTGLEGLYHMVILHPVHFPVGPLGVQHLAALPARVAVEMGSKDLTLRFLAVEDIFDTGVQSTLSG